jgi:hypothetical protein
MMPLMIRRLSLRCAPGWFCGNSGAMAADCRSSSLQAAQPDRTNACRLKDWGRIGTRYDKLSANFATAVALAAIINWWL